MTPAPISVERYTVTGDIAYPSHEDPNGDYVLYDDYAALLQQLAELQAKTACTLGVGDGSGQLFVHGDYESIKAAQGIIDKLAEREAELEGERGVARSWQQQADRLESQLHSTIRRAEAAERAGEEATGLLRRVNASLYLMDKPHREFGGVTDKTATDIAAFLAASGEK